VSDTQTGIEDFLVSRASQAPASAPATAGEAWNAEWDAAGLGTVVGQGRLKEDARAALSDAIAAEAGKPIEDYARDQGIRLGEAGGFDHHVSLLNDLAGTLPDDAQKRLAPLLDVRANAAQKAQQIAGTAAEVAARSAGLSGGAIRFAAGAARQALDPVNIGAMVLTAPLLPAEVAAAPLWMTMAKGALAGAAAQTAQEPLVQAGNAELGLEHGFGPAAEDVLGAAAGGGVLSGGLSLLFRGGAAALRLARRPGVAAASEPAGGGLTSESPKPTGGPLAPADLDAVARLAERDQVMGAHSPDPSVPGQVAHGAALDAATDAIEAGRPIAETHAVAPPEPRDPEIPRASRSELAKTGDPRIDAILDSPITKNAIDHPVINREGTVPYTAGGSVPLEDPEMFVDHRFPKQFTVDSLSDPVNKKVTFDPADPFTVHENSEQHTMAILEAGGMEHGPAYKYSHFKVAEPAEQAWYRASDIDQVKAEAAYAPEMAKIQKGRTDKIPEKLFKDPYPHDQPSAAKREAIAEPGPTPAEIKQAEGILDKWREQQTTKPETPAPAVSDLPLREKAPTEAVEPAPAGKLGDPSLAADVDRVLSENGGDLKIRLDSETEVSARDALGQADEDAAAARELAACAAMETAA